MTIVIAIQARTASTRLPNKVMLPLYGKPLLIRLVDRIKRSALVNKIMIATTEDENDNIISRLCLDEGLDCFRGHSNDLLDRHYKLAIHSKADAIVKIPSDCPLIDPVIIDKVIGFYLDNFSKFDYVSNLHPPTYPDGNDVEIMSFQALEVAWKEAKRDFEREHFTPYIWENPQKFTIGNVTLETGLDLSSSYRWTIDYEEDYQFIKRVYEELFPRNPNFGLYDIIDLMEKQPEIALINKQYLGNYWYMNHLNDLNHIDEYKKKITN
jgi:spore coat polysaccharide biosynthesis protein SpsF